MKIINLWGGPCTGKSTTAAGLFYHMKAQNLEVELVQEYAKDLTWEKRYNVLEDQIYVFAKQQRRIARLADHNVEWVITDSPIPLGLVYVKPNTLGNNFNNLVMEVFDRYDNYNFLLSRNVQYSPVGRNQDHQQALEFDQKVKDLLTNYNIKFQHVLGGEAAINTILTAIGLTPSDCVTSI
jgi:nicotinamide riboside kinase